MIIYRPGQKILTIGGSLKVVSLRGGAVGPVVFDSFSDPDGTLIENHIPDIAPVGSSWIGGQIIKDNTAQSTYDTISVIETGLYDAIITAVLQVDSYAAGVHTRQTGLIVRWTDASNFFRINVVPYNNSFYFLTYNGGVASVGASVNVNIEYGSVHTIRVVLSGMTITATLDGGNEITNSTAHNQTATMHGIATFRNTGAYQPPSYVDDFKVEQLS